MSADGAYVFFQSAKSLVPGAVEGDTNVYEYHEGHVSLISDGHDGATYREEPVVNLLGTTESGSDVFFKTADPLVGQDTDTNADVYDARIGGGFPAPSAPQECSEGGCQGPLSTATPFAAPASATSAGSGNAQPLPGSRPSSHTTGSRKLAAALRACRRIHLARRRIACEATAKRLHGTVSRHRPGGSRRG